MTTGEPSSLFGVVSFIIGAVTIYVMCVIPIERRLTELEGKMKVLKPVIDISLSLGSAQVVAVLKGDRK